jgi:hypothetical protein
MRSKNNYLSMIKFLSEIFNRIINRRFTYKCVAYIDDGKGGDKMVEALEIKEFSLRRAYSTAYDVLMLKYPNTGLDIRIFKQ